MKVSSGAVLFLSVMMLSAGSGCGGGTTDKCAGLTGLCQNEGERKCRSDNLAVITCQLNQDGCLTWTVTSNCGDLQQCTGTGEQTACVCQHACDPQDATRCSGTVIETCAPNSAGCRDWQAGEDCADSELICAMVDGAAQCAEACTSDCDTEGATRCHDDAIETCTASGDCLNWVPTSACTAEHQVCDDASGTALCVCDTGYQDNDSDGTCTPDCSAVTCGTNAHCEDTTGTAACTCDAGNQDNDGDGDCSPDCANAGLTCGANAHCDDASGTAACVCDTGNQDNDSDGDCSPDCANAGLTCGANAHCDDASGTAACVCDAGYQDNDSDGDCSPDCANAGLTCGANAHCDDASGTAACVCDTGYQDNDGDGTCTPDCSAVTCGSNSHCDDTSGTALCVCDTGYQDNDGDGTCTPDCSAVTCGANSHCDDTSGTALCVCDTGYQDNDGDGDCSLDCANAGLDCGPRGYCDDSSGTATCLCNDECTAGQGSCNGDIPQNCVADSYGCYYLEDGSACGTGLFCNVVGGVAGCFSADCSDSLADGDFEGGSPNSSWAEASTNFSTPFCDPSGCGDYAYSGSWYLWFGGCGSSCTFPEDSSATQSVYLPAGQTMKLFFFMFAVAGSGATSGDVMQVTVDGAPVWTVDATNVAPYANGYTLVEVDLSTFADSDFHELAFASSVASESTSFLVDLASLRIGTDCCVDACPQDGLAVCQGDAVFTCETNTTTGCLEWNLTEDCSSNGEVCLTDGSGNPFCQQVSAAVPGVDCTDGNMVPITLPAELPALVVNQTNCGAGDSYSDTCLGSYDGGEDVVFAVDVTAPVTVKFTLDPQGTTWTGMALDDVCPLDSASDGCLVNATSSGGSPYSTACVDLAAGGYYLMVDTWPTPDCIPDFDLVVEECPPPVGDTCTEAVPMDVSGGSAALSVDNGSNSDSFNTYSCVTTARTGADVWTSFTLTEQAQVTIETSGPGSVTDTVLALFDACAGTELGCSDDIGGGNYYSLIQQVLPAGTYYVVSEPYNTTARGDWTITITVTTRSPVTLWDFENQDTTPAVGTGTAALGSGFTASATFPAGNSSSYSWSIADWPTGALDTTRYFEFTTDLTGRTGVAFRFDERRSGTGIHDFELQYSTDGTTFQQVPGSATTVPDDTNWRSHSFDLPAAVEGQAAVTIRILGYNAEGSTGTWRVDNTGFFSF